MVPLAPMGSLLLVPPGIPLDQRANAIPVRFSLVLLPALPLAGLGLALAGLLPALPQMGLGLAHCSAATAIFSSEVPSMIHNDPKTKGAQKPDPLSIEFHSGTDGHWSR